MVQKKELGESGSADITTDGSGDGSLTITLKNPMNSTDYSVQLTIAEADITGNAVSTTKTINDFLIVVDGSAVLSGTLTVDWVARQNAF